MYGLSAKLLALQTAAANLCPDALCEEVGSGKVQDHDKNAGGACASIRYSAVPGAGTRGLPISSSSSSFTLPVKRSTSVQSFVLLLDINSTRRFRRRSMPACMSRQARHDSANPSASMQTI